MGYSSRVIPGVTAEGITRGGGSETVEWARNGPFRMKRIYTVYQLGLPLTSYYGKMVYTTSVPRPSGTVDSDSQIRNDGDTAINIARPTSPSVNILTSAGELAMDGLPSPADLIRWKRTLASLLTMGARDYVAYQFAWKPLESEIRNYCSRVVKSESIISGSRNATNVGTIRVGYDYPTRSTNTSTGGTVNCYGWTSQGGLGNLASGGRSYESYNRTWFEGKYLYFNPIPKSVEQSQSEFSHLARQTLGLRLTPEVLWNLSPWSWFSDWLTNTDIAIGAVSDALGDGMVPVSSFVMHHHRRQSVVAAGTPHMSGDGKIARFSPCVTKSLDEQKLRFPSVPYLGFGGGVASLSAKQLSILAALGISHAG